MTNSATKGAPKRGGKNPAKPGQLVSFILVDRKPFYHATIEDADKERKFLEAKTGREFKLLKVINCSSEEFATGRVVAIRNA